MHDDLRQAVDALMPTLQRDFETLVRIPSVSAAGYDPADLLTGAACADVRTLKIDGAHPAVFAAPPGPPKAANALLYAHHDVQPRGPAADWDTPPFEPSRRNGRLHGRGSSDDKAGVMAPRLLGG